MPRCSGHIGVFDARDDCADAVVLLHWLAPTSSVVPSVAPAVACGSATALAWSPDGRAIAAGWIRCGPAIWSVFGTPLDVPSVSRRTECRPGGGRGSGSGTVANGGVDRDTGSGRRGSDEEQRIELVALSEAGISSLVRTSGGCCGCGGVANADLVAECIRPIAAAPP